MFSGFEPSQKTQQTRTEEGLKHEEKSLSSGAESAHKQVGLTDKVTVAQKALNSANSELNEANKGLIKAINEGNLEGKLFNAWQKCNAAEQKVKTSLGVKELNSTSKGHVQLTETTHASKAALQDLFIKNDCKVIRQLKEEIEGEIGTANSELATLTTEKVSIESSLEVAPNAQLPVTQQGNSEKIDAVMRKIASLKENVKDFEVTLKAKGVSTADEDEAKAKAKDEDEDEDEDEVKPNPNHSTP